MNDELNHTQTLDPEQERAKAAVLSECDKLAAAGITFAAAHFDGCGDEGTVEQVKCYQAPSYSYYDSEPVPFDAEHLQEHFDALVPLGFGDNCGSFGDVILDVKARKLTVEYNERFEDYNTTSYEI